MSLNQLTGMQNVDIRAFLCAVYDLRDEELLNRICEVASLRGYEPKQIIAEVGAPMREIQVLVSGTVRTFYVDADGVSSTDCFINQAGFPLNSPRLDGRAECGLEACGWVTVITIPLDWMLTEREHSMPLMQLQLKLMEWAIYFQWNEKVKGTRLNAMQRYVRFLKDFPGLDGQISSKYIAEYIGVAPESLSRLRRELRQRQTERRQTSGKPKPEDKA